jgi:hypothetical protein
MISPIGGDYFAEIALMVNLQSRNSWFTSDVCSTPHLFKLNNGGGKFDNCITIDPYVAKIASKEITTILINVRNSQEGARIYDLHLLLNLDFLGFPKTVASDWNEQTVEQDYKKNSLLRM